MRQKYKLPQWTIATAITTIAITIAARQGGEVEASNPPQGSRRISRAAAYPYWENAASAA